MAAPVADIPYAARRRLGLRGELALAALPTAAVLLVLAFVEALARLWEDGTTLVLRCRSSCATTCWRPSPPRSS